MPCHPGCCQRWGEGETAIGTSTTAPRRPGQHRFEIGARQPDAVMSLDDPSGHLEPVGE